MSSESGGNINDAGRNELASNILADVQDETFCVQTAINSLIQGKPNSIMSKLL